MLRRRLLKPSGGGGGDFVDLRLPSGRKWAKGNIVPDGNGGYKIGEETDWGAYFSWGNIVPHFSTNGSTFDGGYDFGTSISGPYASTPGAGVSADIANNDAQHDAALALLGSPWHLPTLDDVIELNRYTDKEWTTINGVLGLKCMKKTNHSIYVFLPASGYSSSNNGKNLNFRGMYGEYWENKWYNNEKAYSFSVNQNLSPSITDRRFIGYSIRAVQ